MGTYNFTITIMKKINTWAEACPRILNGKLLNSEYILRVVGMKPKT